MRALSEIAAIAAIYGGIWCLSLLGYGLGMH